MVVILLDVGNVLVLADKEKTFERLKEYGVPLERAKRFFDNEEYKLFDIGAITGREFYEALATKYLRFGLTQRAVQEAHHAHIYGVDMDTIRVLQQLSSSHRVAIVTNTNEWQEQRVGELFEKEGINLGTYVERIFRSNEMGMLKTDDRCFPYILSELGIKEGESIIIDDNASIIRKSEEAGVGTGHFKNVLYIPNRGATQLISDLKGQGLL